MADRSSFRNWVESLSHWAVSSIWEAWRSSTLKFKHTGNETYEFKGEEFVTPGNDDDALAYFYVRYVLACRRHDEEPGAFELVDE